MSAPSYLEEASRRFLQGTAFESPAAAVEAGYRSTLEWCIELDRARLEFGVRDYASRRPLTASIAEEAA